MTEHAGEIFSGLRIHNLLQLTAWLQAKRQRAGNKSPVLLFSLELVASDEDGPIYAVDIRYNPSKVSEEEIIDTLGCGPHSEISRSPVSMDTLIAGHRVTREWTGDHFDEPGVISAGKSAAA